MPVTWPLDENLGLSQLHGHGPSVSRVEAALSLFGIDGGERPAQNIQDGRRHLAYLCPESMPLVDGATWDRCYIYARPIYSLCTLRSITAYPRWFLRLWRLVSMNLPRISLSAGPLVMRVEMRVDECHLHCTRPHQKCAPDHSARRWL